MTTPPPKSKGLSDRLKLAAIPVLLGVLYFVMAPSESRSSAVNTASRKTSGAASPATGPRDQSEPHKPARTRALPSLPLSHILEHDPFKLPAPFLPRSAQRLLDNAAASDAIPSETERAEAPVTNLLSAALNPTVPSPEERLASVRQRKVNLVMHDRHGPIAMVGKKLVRVGDTLEENIRVVSIDHNGVVLEWISPEQPATNSK